MKTLSFPAYCMFGRGDSGETEVEVELTDEEYDKVIQYGTDEDYYYDGFADCEDLKDIYDKVYAIAVEQMTDEIRAFGDLDAKYADDPNWKVDDLYACEVNFPFEFEEIIEEG